MQNIPIFQRICLLFIICMSCECLILIKLLHLLKIFLLIINLQQNEHVFIIYIDLNKNKSKILRKSENTVRSGTACSQIE